MYYLFIKILFNIVPKHPEIPLLRRRNPSRAQTRPGKIRILEKGTIETIGRFRNFGKIQRR